MGVFVTQWGVGKIIAFVTTQQGSTLLSFQVAFYALAILSTLSYFWFLAFDKVFAARASSVDRTG
jgi:hypothetical protein